MCLRTTPVARPSRWGTQLIMRLAAEQRPCCETVLSDGKQARLADPAVAGLLAPALRRFFRGRATAAAGGGALSPLVGDATAFDAHGWEYSFPTLVRCGLYFICDALEGVDLQRESTTPRLRSPC